MFSRVYYVLLWLLALQGAGLYIFMHGFLLTRMVLEDKSPCKPVFGIVGTEVSSDAPSCSWHPPAYKRAVILLVDALRYDFLFYNETAAQLPAESLGTAAYFTNHLSTVNKLLKFPHGNHFAQIYKFIADAPTTTMQRIKGLTTGSLPTFIDAGNNFDSTAIEEDNMLMQLVQAGHKIVHMGDDTWAGLFPSIFLRSFPYDSFNVGDLHTVDRGVKDHMVDEIHKNDWSVLIGHMLGVDHCGHTYGPHHPAMSDKLYEVDDMISTIVHNLSNDTILLVFGDHGMTESGDHGGDSSREVEAGLFIYAPNQPGMIGSPTDMWDQWLRPSDASEKSDRRIVQQVDLVATLSLLLGSPLPFGNLGGIIPELFFTVPPFSNGGTDDVIKGFMNLNKAMRVNVGQMRNFLMKYAERTSGFGGEDERRLADLYDKAIMAYTDLHDGMNIKLSNDDILLVIQKQRQAYILMQDYIVQARALCRSIWAQFDINDMKLGMGILGCTVLTMILYINACHLENFQPWLRIVVGGILGGISCGLGRIIGSEITDIDISSSHILTLGGAALGSMIGHASVALPYWLHNRNNNMTRTLQPDWAIATVCVCLHCGMYFSNSYVVHMDHIAGFLLCTLCAAYIWVLMASIRTKDPSRQYGTTLLAAIALPAVIRLVREVSYMCREEQLDCKAGTNHPVWLLTILLVLWGSACYYWMGHWNWRQGGNLHGGVYLVMHYILPITIGSIIGYWGLHYAAGGNIGAHYSSFIQTILPKIVYGMSLLSLYYLLCPQMTPVYPIKQLWAGEATALSACLVALLIVIQWVVLLITQPQYVIGVLGLSVGAFCVLQMHTGVGLIRSAQLMGHGEKANKIGSSHLKLVSRDGSKVMDLAASGGPRIHKVPVSTRVSHQEVATNNMIDIIAGSSWGDWSGIAAWSLCSVCFFYATGHQTTFPTVQWSAAFVGFSSMNYWASVILVSLNTFCSPLLISLALPLLALWPCGRARRILLLPGCETSLLSSLPSSPSLPGRVERLSVLWLLYRTCLVTSAAGAAFLHRRHLMVWKIFAPQLLFEALTGVIITIATGMGLAFLDHITGHWLRWRSSSPTTDRVA